MLRLDQEQRLSHTDPDATTSDTHISTKSTNNTCEVSALSVTKSTNEHNPERAPSATSTAAKVPQTEIPTSNFPVLEGDKNVNNEVIDGTVQPTSSLDTKSTNTDTELANEQCVRPDQSTKTAVPTSVNTDKDCAANSKPVPITTKCTNVISMETYPDTVGALPNQLLDDPNTTNKANNTELRTVNLKSTNVGQGLHDTVETKTTNNDTSNNNQQRTVNLKSTNEANDDPVPIGQRNDKNSEQDAIEGLMLLRETSGASDDQENTEDTQLPVDSDKQPDIVQELDLEKAMEEPTTSLDETILYDSNEFSIISKEASTEQKSTTRGTFSMREFGIKKRIPDTNQPASNTTDLAANDDSLEDTSEKIKCLYCNRHFNTPTERIQHINRRHRDLVPTPTPNCDQLQTIINNSATYHHHEKRKQAC